MSGDNPRQGGSHPGSGDDNLDSPLKRRGRHIRHPVRRAMGRGDGDFTFDTELIDWAAASELPLLVLLNKADKLKHGAQQQTLAKVRRYLADMPHAQVLTFSALKGQGVNAVLEVLQGWFGEGAA